MKSVISLFAAASFALVGFAIVGCDSMDRPSDNSHSATFSGGNGEFGESTEQAGQYQNGQRTHAPQSDNVTR